MSRKTLTTPFLDNLKTPPRGKRAEHRDTTPGLTLRVNDRGVKTWTLTYRVSGQGGTGQDGRSLQGKTRRLNIGRYPEMTLRDARTKADELWTLAAGGRDPAAQRHQRVMDRRETEQLTFRVVTDRWIEEAERGRRVGPKGAIGPGYLGDRRSDLEKMVMKHLGHRPVVDITKSDVRDALDAIDREEETGRRRGFTRSGSTTRSRRSTAFSTTPSCAPTGTTTRRRDSRSATSARHATASCPPTSETRCGPSPGSTATRLERRCGCCCSPPSGETRWARCGGKTSTSTGGSGSCP